jgi:chromosome segregation ATPase
MDMLKTSRDEDNRRRDEAQFYSLQQQLDELRRQLKENLARQQWFEELYKQNEGKLAQVQVAQDRLTHDVSQSMHARQIDEARLKAQVAELVQQVEAPGKQIRELRAQIHDLAESRKSDRDVDSTAQRQIDELQGQIRELNAHISQVGDSQRQLRDLIQELDSALAEVRQEAIHVAELQTLEEQRLRRQGMELQGMFESLRQQFSDVSAKSQRVDDVRRQLTERIEAVEDRIGSAITGEESLHTEVERVEKQANEQDLIQQERLETVRVQIDAQLGEMRTINDQRTDRIMLRFNGIDDRMRAIEQALSEIPSRFDALERRDEILGSETDTIEEWLVMRQLQALEAVLDDVRKRRADRASTFNPRAQAEPTPGSVRNPSGLIKSVRDAKPPNATDQD